jgi:hypothetical protein
MKITIFHLGGWKAQGLPKGGFGHVLARKQKKGELFVRWKRPFLEILYVCGKVDTP